MGYIYMITNNITGKTYIGQTTRPIKTRLEEHETGKSRNCRLIYRSIQKHGWDNFEKDWYECPDNDLNNHENLMIEVLGTLSPGGYNLKEGGSNGKDSDETKEKKSNAKKDDKNPNFGKATSKEIKQVLSNANKGEKHPMFGKKQSAETIKKRIEALTGKKRSEKFKQMMRDLTLGENNHNSKRVYQYDLDNIFICSFGSCGEAARHLKKSCSSIRACAREERKNAHGFKWSYIKPMI
jgi:group I intron endonuclease